MHQARPHPQRRPRRPPRQRQDVAARGAAVRGRRHQPARHRHGRHDRLGLRRRTSRRARCRSPRASPRSSGTTARSTSSTRPASPASSPTRSARCACASRRSSSSTRVMGVEVGDRAPVGARRRARPRAPDLREHARPRARRLLPHARLAQGRLRPARRRDRDPDRLRARGPRPDRPRRHEGLRVRRRPARATTAREIPIPDDMAAHGRGVPREAHGRGRRGLRRADGALPRGRGDLPRRDRHRAQGGHEPRRRSSRSTCGVATRNLGTNRLLDAIVEDLPSPVKHGGLELPEITLEPDPTTATLYAYVFKTLADPFAGRINLFRVYQGVDAATTRTCSTRAPTRKERIGQLLEFRGQGDRPRRRVRPRRHRRGREAQGDARRRLARRARRADRDAGDRRCPRR